MSGLLKVYNYRYISPLPTEESESSATIRVSTPIPSYVTALVIVDGEIVDFRTSDSALVTGYMEIEVPDVYKGRPYSVFVFSAKNGYSNRDIGKESWGVWFENLQEESFVDFGKPSRPKGSVLLVVPLKGAGFNITFNRIGDSAAAHGEVSSSTGYNI